MRDPRYKNILIVRTDRIGDVVLTLPIIDVLRRSFPSARISFLARSYTKDIVTGYSGLDEVLVYDRPDRRKSFTAKLTELRRRRFDLAVVAFPRFRIALLLWLAGIRTRVGSGYRWYSFLFNPRVYEHRKAAEKHECDYNLSLLKVIGCDIPLDIWPKIPIAEESRARAFAERKRLEIASREKVAILHPGSGGSSRDWSADNFGKLAVQLEKNGWTVVVTGATEEATLVKSVVDSANGTAKSTVGRLDLKELAAFIQSADLFVSNSTGPLHIAAAVGTPVIAFYPPIKACSPERWGPLTKKKIVFVPDRSKCELCEGGRCQGNVCMDQISVSQVVEAAQKLTSTRMKSRKTMVHS